MTFLSKPHQIVFSKVALGIACLGFGTGVGAQSLPDVAALELFAVYEESKAGDPETALAIADDILARTQDTDLRLYFAQSALDANAPARALEFLTPILNTLGKSTAVYDQADPRASQALDLAAQAYAALGKRREALQTSLEAYNAAEARLGAENLALLDRLAVLEPEVEELWPELLPALKKMRKRVSDANAPKATPFGNTSTRAVGSPTAVQVWFGTNRVPTGSTDPAQMFGSDRGTLTLGKLTVTIPPDHTAGMIERPSGWFFTEHLDPSKHVVLESLKTLAFDTFAEGCCAAEDRLLFIHGYNVTFHDGALRAAQLFFDLEFPGQAMYYSWPSKATVYGYLSDSNGVLATRPAMEDFFEIATRGEGKLHVIAHSMGNRYAVEALETFFLKHPDRRLGQLVLAAPDVDRAELVARFDALKNHSDGVTLYASKNDLALQVSNKVNGGRRAGDANGDLLRIEGLDTVDASLIEADSLGHSYFGDAPEMLGDILGLVRLGWRPPERCGVAMREGSDEGGVWDVKPGGCAVQEVRAAGDLVRLFGATALDEARRRMDIDGSSRREFWLGVMNVIEERF
ncbi:Esterase/lipase superfamily enzyme [Shimia gijangensis]|uniref:Esterase/lipase superfamily enzyme n=1 Tax=Shimia gijangensis TaxID=1470563 RepID=A0A1M6HIK5_9RHOB|nr:alpha/beta hydrolase [Shimia gijangensis]SHJ21972.1 Esterase/lipase superfamily enzyme [Shimia gijangensis]